MLIDDHGRIIAVGPSELVPTPENSESLHLGDAVLLPGFVNTHTHLELSLDAQGLRFLRSAQDKLLTSAAPRSGSDFIPWLRSVMTYRDSLTEEDLFNAAIGGIQRGWAAGVTTVCDTGSSGAVIAALHHLQASGVAHHEVFGPHPEQFDTVMPAFIKDLDRLAHHATGRVALGLSPHAPYTVSARLYRATADLARAHGAPIAIHIAESAEETELLDEFTGPFAERFRDRGIDRPSMVPITPMQWVAQHDILGSRTLCIHTIDVNEHDIEIMRRTNSPMAHCPRSNHRHHHRTAPVQQMISAGIRVGLGTDSEMSLAPADLLAEARAAQANAAWTHRDAIRILTLGGAEAIGLEKEIGSLEKGKIADIVAIGVVKGSDPEAAVIASGIGDVIATWVGGEKRFTSP